MARMNDFNNTAGDGVVPSEQPASSPARHSVLSYLVAGLLILIVAGLGWYVFLRETMPDLDHTYTPRADLPQDIQDESAAKVAQAVADLRDNPGLISRWLELAAQFKGIYDYEFAEEVYRYVIRQWPEDVTAYGNLADMYRYELKRYDDSAVYWRKVIALKPDFISAYRELHFLYRYNIESTEAVAVQPLMEGLTANPGATDLLIPLANYYRDVVKDNAKARHYFTEARAAASEAGNTRLVGQIDEELRALPQ